MINICRVWPTMAVTLVRGQDKVYGASPLVSTGMCPIRLEARCSYESTSAAIRTVIGEPHGDEERVRADNCDVYGWSGGVSLWLDPIVIGWAAGCALIGLW